MLNRLRRVIIVGLAGIAAIAGQLAAIAPAQAASPGITIAVTSRFGPVTHDVYVVYHASEFTQGTIHGTITRATAGEVAALYGQEFPYRKPAVRLGSLTLKSGKAAYSFRVTPVLATRYAVRLFPNGSATAKMVATSPAVNLYVIANGFFNGGNSACGRPVCHETVRVFSIVPTSALGAEMGKRIHPYFGLSLGFVNIPPPPKWVYLDGGHARAAPARRISAIEFENTISFSFSIGDHSYFWSWLTCFRDSESTDGIGLPGSHECGASRVPRTPVYLGLPAR